MTKERGRKSRLVPEKLVFAPDGGAGGVRFAPLRQCALFWKHFVFEIVIVDPASLMAIIRELRYKSSFDPVLTRFLVSSAQSFIRRQRSNFYDSHCARGAHRANPQRIPFDRPHKSRRNRSVRLAVLSFGSMRGLWDCHGVAPLRTSSPSRKETPGRRASAFFIMLVVAHSIGCVGGGGGSLMAAF